MKFTFMFFKSLVMFYYIVVNIIKYILLEWINEHLANYVDIYILNVSRLFNKSFNWNQAINRNDMLKITYLY